MDSVRQTQSSVLSSALSEDDDSLEVESSVGDILGLDEALLKTMVSVKDSVSGIAPLSLVKTTVDSSKSLKSSDISWWWGSW